MFLYQTHKHLKRQEDHLLQNSLPLQTTQNRKGMWAATDSTFPATSPLHGQHHNIQNPGQQHTFHQGRGHDNDGHKKTII
jgi:hypothetical protein